jgi:hypothetical protein
MLSAFVVAQIVFDVAVVALAAVYLLTRQAPRAPEPPEWYAHFLKLAQDLMAATEPVLERLESRAPVTPPVDLGALNGRRAAPAGGSFAAVAEVPDERRDRSAGGLGGRPEPPISNESKYEKARTMLRQGSRPDDVAAHMGLQPGELRLLTRIVAAESRPRSG